MNLRRALVGLAALLALVGVGLIVAIVVGMGASIGDRGERRDACNSAARLLDAGMLDGAQVWYRRVAASDEDGTCARRPLERIERRQEQRVRRLERARLYRRVADLRARAGRGQARTQARLRAYYAYVVGLALDSFASGARRGLRSLLARYRDPPGEWASCRRARELVGLGLLPEARLVYARAIRRADRPRCEEAAALLRDTQARAYAALRGAEADERADRPDDAREGFIAALTLDSSLGAAASGLARVGPPPVPDRGGWAAKGLDRFGSVFGDPVRLVAIVTAIFVIGALLLIPLSHAVRRFARSSPDRRKAMEELPFTRAITHVQQPVVRPQVHTDAEADVDRELWTALSEPPVVAEEDADAITRSRLPVDFMPVKADGKLAQQMDAITPLAGGAVRLHQRFAARSTSAYDVEYEYAPHGDGEVKVVWRIRDRETGGIAANGEVLPTPGTGYDSPDERRRRQALRASEEIRRALDTETAAT